MEHQILYHPAVSKEDIPKLPSNIKQSIRRAIEERLIKNPIQAGLPLRQSLKGHRKLRVGNYRVVYRIQGKIIIILKIGHRKDVYLKPFRRL